jgi:DNA-entry nuclease
MNCDGQLPYENEVDDYVDSTGNHVLYRVTPIFDGDNLVASGVLTEAYSVEDEGAGVQFCVYSYNVQPGIGIDYATGESWLIEGYTGEYATTTYYSTKKIKNYAEGSSETSEKESSGSTSGQETNTANTETKSESTNETASSEDGYVLNTGTKKFHKADCRYAESTSEANRKETTETKEQLVSEGYEACKVCNP